MFKYNVTSKEGIIGKEIRKSEFPYCKIKFPNNKDPQIKVKGNVFIFEHAFNLPHNIWGCVEDPQLKIRYSSKLLLSSESVATISWYVGGTLITTHPFPFIAAFCKLLNGSCFIPMKKFVSLLGTLLKRKSVHDHVARSVVIHAVLQHKKWAPYAWMLDGSHEFEFIENTFAPEYMFPLCFGFMDRFVPQWQQIRFVIEGVPKEISQISEVTLAHCDVEINRIQERQQIFSQLFHYVPRLNFSGNKVKLESNELNGLVYCIFINIEGPVHNINFFELFCDGEEFISGPLRQMPYSKNWYYIMTDPNITITQLVNMQKLPPESTKYINFTQIKTVVLLLSTVDDTKFKISKENRFNLYCPVLNILLDLNGMCGPQYAY